MVRYFLFFVCSLSYPSSSVFSLEKINNNNNKSKFKSTHHSTSPRCDCRILPMALFLVDRQMYAEAFEVFWPNAFMDFYSDSFSISLAAMRRLPLHSLTHIQFTMSLAQADGWGLGARACGFPEGWYRRLGLHGDGDSSGVERPDHQSEWAAVVAFLAEQAELLPRLRITVDFGSCGWGFADEGEMLALEEVDFGWFRFLYDFVIDAVTALCRLKTLREVRFELFPFANLESWLEREVMGCRNGYGEIEPPSRRGYGNHIPSWHDMNKRLEGSNYHPN